jgi:hypothetical protein
MMKWIVLQCENWKNMDEIYKRKKRIFMFLSEFYFGKWKDNWKNFIY